MKVRNACGSTTAAARRSSFDSIFARCSIGAGDWSYSVTWPCRILLASIDSQSMIRAPIASIHARRVQDFGLARAGRAQHQPARRAR